ncbi:MAG: hypothetical protein HY873_03075, partial [Chloroflexi bacterium]|nr:hypothetical protein [Chloroflexota bacterium]
MESSRLWHGVPLRLAALAVAFAAALTPYISHDPVPLLLALGENSITSPDTGIGTGNVGGVMGDSLVLDASGFPVVAYSDITNSALKIMHCNDPVCAGGDESLSMADASGSTGSLKLDANGYPVVSYAEVDVNFALDLKVLHCNDPNCLGGDESITVPDSQGDVGKDASLELDSSGFPVVTYWDLTNYHLKVLHCNDPNCAGDDESITSPDTTGAPVGEFSSLVLDANGFPVISYHNRWIFPLPPQFLTIMHCNDADCSGGDESISYLGSMAYAPSSLSLDASGFPVAAYIKPGQQYAVSLVHCNDPNCVGGDESVTSPNQMPSMSSMVLDASGYPVISQAGAAGLNIIHCVDPACAGSATVNTPTQGGSSALVLDATGRPVVAIYEAGDLVILHCDDPDCAGGGDTATTPDRGDGGDVGAGSSLALDASGAPVVAYFDRSDKQLRVMHCNEANCSGGDESISTPDGGFYQWHYAEVVLDLVLDAGGFPVIAYSRTGELVVLHCNDVNCQGGDESITVPDAVASSASLRLDADGFPVVAYRGGSGDLKILHCNDPACAGGDDSIAFADTVGNVGFFPSLTLDSSGYPVVSHHDETSYDLKVVHCNDANCQGGDESITAPDVVGVIGLYNTSLVLDPSGFPVVAYHDASNQDLKLLHCNDPDCATGGDSITSPDSIG